MVKTLETFYENYLLGSEINLFFICFCFLLIILVLMILKEIRRRTKMSEDQKEEKIASHRQEVLKQSKDDSQEHTYKKAMDMFTTAEDVGPIVAGRLFAEIKIMPSDNEGAIALIGNRVLVFSKEATPKIGEAITSYFEKLI